MNISKMMDVIKQHPEFDKVGMVLCHNGIVRGTSRDGRKVEGLRVSVDHRKLDQIVSEQKKRPGILKIQEFYDIWPANSETLANECLPSDLPAAKMKTWSLYRVRFRPRSGRGENRQCAW